MNSEKKFLETLKTLGFPYVNKYSAADFESNFADPQLRPFLEYFCTLDEDNILTSEELDEYASITPQEMKALEELAANESEYLKEEKKNEKEEQAEFLTEKLSHLERKYNSLEEQRKILLEHEAVLLKEISNCEAANKSLRRLFDDFSLNKVPQGIAQLSTTLKSISTLIFNLKDVSDIADENMVLPFLNYGDVEEYFKNEEKLSSLVLTNLLNDFQFEDEDNTILNIPGLSKLEVSKEIHILKNSLKVSKTCEIKSVCSKIKTDKTVMLIKKFQNGYFDEVLEMSTAQLSYKFEKAAQVNEYLKKKEALLQSHLSDAIEEHVEAQSRQIAIAHCHETRLIYKNSLENISRPLQYLLNQKARIEFLNLLINIHQEYWQDVKDLLYKIFHFVDSEKESCLFRQQKIEEFMKQAKVEETHLSPDSIFVSAYKVLSDDIENQEQPLITLPDVVKSLEKLFERKEFISKIKDENSEVIKILAKQYLDLEKNISNGIDYDELMREEKKFSTKVNQTEVLLEEISSFVKESENDWQQKNKLLVSQKHLRLARSLFIFALLEREKFEKIAGNIVQAKPHLL
uniref:HAUS augmin-like complex subunit 3 n=1 Tax=Parasteatoda tepidariorum TaxID=114398 RepID=A0A2L2YGR4_PARTP